MAKKKATGGRKPKNPFAAKLKKAKQTAQAAKERAQEAGSPGGSVDDGRYIGKLVEATLGETTRFWCRWVLEVLSGEFEGVRVTTFDGLESENNWFHFLRKVAMFGYDLEEFDIEDLPEILEEMVGEEPQVRFRVVTKGEWQNVYFDKALLGEARLDEDELDEGVDDDDDMEDDVIDEDEDEDDEEGDADSDSEEEEEDDEDEEEDEEEDEDDEEEDEDDEDEDEEEDYESDLEVGDVVEFRKGKKTLTGDVVKIDEEAEVCNVKRHDNGKIVKGLTADQITKLEAELDS